MRTELQADCYAGVWAHYAAITKQESTEVPYLEPLTDNDIAMRCRRPPRWATTGSRRVDRTGQSGVVDARLV